MTHQQKIDTLIAAIDDNIVFPDDQKKAIAAALVEGFLRILLVEDAEEKARIPYEYFPVELSIPEGFAIWNRGGFDSSRNIGSALLCAGIDGQHTRIYRSIKEVNGRHLLTSIYQGCYIIQSKVLDYAGSPIITIYQVVGFASRNGTYQARCRKVYNNIGLVPKIPESDMMRLQQMMGLSGNAACTPNLTKLEWSV